MAALFEEKPETLLDAPGGADFLRWVTAWPVPVRAGQAMVDLDAVVTDTEGVQPVALCGEI
ncbi:MAG TPA: hypothetical protein VK390_10870 [Propionibacteriaceae bacterium]|nr:hypothetical protein [Propionibacteriaceae bacterium]